MLIKNTEPGTFTRLAYHNTKIAARKGQIATWGPAGLLAATASAYLGTVFTGKFTEWWEFPAIWALTFLILLMFDAVIGTVNTLTEIKVLDTLEARHDHGCKTCQEEGEQGGEGEGGVSV